MFHTLDGIGFSHQQELEVTIDASHVGAKFGDASNPSYNFGVGNDSTTGMFHTLDGIGFSHQQDLEVTIDASHVGAKFGDASNPSYNFGVGNDSTTGMFHTQDGIGFSHQQELEVTIDASHVGVQAGSATNPSYNFGVDGDSDTGIYRPSSDTIGFSVAGLQKASINATTSGSFIDGLNVGLPANIAGIHRLSAISGSGWQDGHLGNHERLYFTATDVMPSTAGPRTLVTWQQGRVPPCPPPVVYSSTSSPIPNVDWCISKLIPTGFGIGNRVCIITQGGSPAGYILNSISVCWYNLSECSWKLGSDISPPPPLFTDTALALQATSTVSGTGSANPQIIVSIQFQCTALAGQPPPEGIVGGWIEIQRG